MEGVLRRVLDRLEAAEHRLALRDVDEDVRRGSAAVVALEEPAHHRAGHRALLGQLADGSTLGRLAGLDAAAREDGVLATVETTGDDEQLGASDDHGDGARLGTPERDPSGHFLPAFSPAAPVESAAMNAS
jgi:hypothetical protein